MFHLLKVLQSVLPHGGCQRDQDDDYLSRSTDVHDLERRQRTLDERGRNPLGGIALGLYAR